MFKPTIHCGWTQPDLGEFSKNISLSIDDLTVPDQNQYNVFLQIEPNSINGMIDSIFNNHGFYDLILCWDEKLLKLENSELFPFGTCWINDPHIRRENKKDSISFLTSNKNITSNHNLRRQIYNQLPNKNGKFNIVKHMSPPKIENKLDIMGDSKYSIIIENECQTNWFTEKIIDCFITDTIPLYYGCPNIGDFFNKDGIICFNNFNSLMGVFNDLNHKDVYDNLKNIIEENHIKSLQYVDLWERVSRRLQLI